MKIVEGSWHRRLYRQGTRGGDGVVAGSEVIGRRRHKIFRLSRRRRRDGIVEERRGGMPIAPARATADFAKASR